MKRKPIIKDDDNYYMTKTNLKICVTNQEAYETPELNDSLQLQYYGFVNIENLEPFQNLIALYLNNNTIQQIKNLESLRKIITLNLSNNRIRVIENLDTLKQIVILDLSGNKIQTVSGLSQLSKLENFNLSNNLLKTPESITKLEESQSVTFLNLNNNPLEADPLIHDVLDKLPKLLTLYMKDTPFSRGIQNYRRMTICRVKSITYLDQRPVTDNERLLAQAWKEGGILRERQVRKTIQQSNAVKSKKIYQEIMERQATVQVKRDDLFNVLTKLEQQELTKYQEQRQNIRKLNAQLKDADHEQKQIKLLDRKIEEIQLYLQAFKEDVKYMDLEPNKKQVPTSLCYDVIDNCIVVYGVSQEDIPKIVEVHFPNEHRTIIGRDFEKKKEVRWIQEYDSILQQLKQYYKDTPQLIIPTFNITVHKFDLQYQRKARRFQENELNSKIKQSDQFEMQNTNQMDTLD